MTRPAKANSFLSKAYKARRTALYVPAANSRALEKARTMDADVVILDLEDAVAAEDKARARETAAAMLKSFGHSGCSGPAWIGRRKAFSVA